MSVKKPFVLLCLRMLLTGAVFVPIVLSLLLPATASAYEVWGLRFDNDVNTMYYATSVWPWRDALDGARAAWNTAGSKYRMWWGESPQNSYAYGANMGYYGGILAETWWADYPSSFHDGRIRFNTYHPWSLSGESHKFDVQNVASHEMGHWGGLDDLYAGGTWDKTMYAYTATGETYKRTLESDDIAGIRYVYGTP